MPKFRLSSSYTSKHNQRKEKEQEEKLREHGNMVIVHNGRDMDSLNDALRRLRKKLEAEGTMDDLRKASYYVKPSKRKREKRRANIKKAIVDNRMHRNRQNKTKSGW